MKQYQKKGFNVEQALKDAYTLYRQFQNECRNYSAGIECEYCRKFGLHPDTSVICFYDYLSKTQGVPNNLKGE